MEGIFILVLLNVGVRDAYDCFRAVSFAIVGNSMQELVLIR
jgi:hypothetical protein